MRFRRIIIVILLIIPVYSYAQNREYLIKGSFLEKFAQLTEWPVESKKSDTKNPFIISIIGGNPFGKILDQRYEQHKIKDKKVNIKYISDIDDIPGSHLLYITRSMKQSIPKILLITENKPILTISEIEGFAEKGGHINFYITDNGTLHFEINEKRVKQSGLRMHLLLIEIAKIVKQ